MARTRIAPLQAGQRAASASDDSGGVGAATGSGDWSGSGVTVDGCGGDYFTFLLIGSIFAHYLSFGMRHFGRELEQELVAGTLSRHTS